LSWTLVDTFDGFLKNSLGAEAGFHKVNSWLAQLFIKYEGAEQSMLQDVRTLEGGLLLPSQNSFGSND
jgi:hypothetical protein